MTILIFVLNIQDKHSGEIVIQTNIGNGLLSVCITNIVIHLIVPA